MSDRETLIEECARAIYAVDDWGREWSDPATPDKPLYRAYAIAALTLALTRAAEVALRWEGRPCKHMVPPNEEYRSGYDDGQMDASASIHAALSALIPEPPHE